MTTETNPAVEISLSFGELEDFEHEGFYNTIDEAIEALRRLKKYYEDSND